MLICMNCLNKYDKDLLVKINDIYICPNIDCECDDLVECDELIVGTILELNKKGYPTQYCCSGHVKNSGKTLNQIYILFEDMERDEYYFNHDDIVSLINLGFSHEIFNTLKGKCAHRIYYDTIGTGLQKEFETATDGYEKHKISSSYVFKNNLNLYKWALSLPDKNM